MNNRWGLSFPPLDWHSTLSGKLKDSEIYKFNKEERNMLEKNVKVKLKSGLQARPAALFVQEANRFSSDISIESESRTVNAKSIMGIMSLAIGSGKTIKIIADGSDEAEALEVLTKFVEDENN